MKLRRPIEHRMLMNRTIKRRRATEQAGRETADFYASAEGRRRASIFLDPEEFNCHCDHRQSWDTEHPGQCGWCGGLYPQEDSIVSATPNNVPAPLDATPIAEKLETGRGAFDVMLAKL
jgi:hypothetical protein